jgi:heme A synthase
MCFSATASFSAAAVLGTVGVVALNKVKSKDQLMFASIPLLFGIQQAIEGLVWVSLTHSSDVFLRQFFTYGFLFFAQVLWA